MGQIQSSDRDLLARVADDGGHAPVTEDETAPADTVHVETHGSQVILTGTVRSWAESNRACHAAWSLPGVTDVDNRLRVV